MQGANTLYFRVTEQKAPSGTVLGTNILAGFDPKLVYKTASYRETGVVKLTTMAMMAVVQKLAQHANADRTENVTALGMMKKMAKYDELEADGLL
jgi:hypothetical protein